MTSGDAPHIQDRDIGALLVQQRLARRMGQFQGRNFCSLMLGIICAWQCTTPPDGRHKVSDALAARNLRADVRRGNIHRVARHDACEQLVRPRRRQRGPHLCRVETRPRDGDHLAHRQDRADLPPMRWKFAQGVPADDQEELVARPGDARSLPSVSTVYEIPPRRISSSHTSKRRFVRDGQPRHRQPMLSRDHRPVIRLVRRQRRRDQQHAIEPAQRQRSCAIIRWPRCGGLNGRQVCPCDSHFLRGIVSPMTTPRQCIMVCAMKPGPSSSILMASSPPSASSPASAPCSSPCS